MRRVFRQKAARSHNQQLERDLARYAGAYDRSNDNDKRRIKTATVTSLRIHLPYMNIDHCRVLADDFSQDNGRFVYVRHERGVADQLASRLKAGATRLFGGRDAHTEARPGYSNTRTYIDCMQLL